MSQPCEQFNIAAVDPFLTPTEQEIHLARTLPDEFRGPRVDHPVFSPNTDDVLDELDFWFHEVSEVQSGSSSSSSTSTPEPHSYHPRSFGPDVPCPVALPSTPYVHNHKNQHNHRPEAVQAHEHRYQRTHTPNDSIDSPIVSTRFLPFRSSTNSDFLSSVSTPQPHVRHLSLNQSDIDQFVDHHPNPALVRLRERRARSTTPEEKRRPGPYPTRSRATSGGRSRGRPVQAPSISRRGSSYLNRAGPMHPGTSLDSHETVSGEKVDYDPLLDDEFFLNHMSWPHHNGPAIRHMTDLHDLERSRHIIEIGAMSAVNRPNHAHIELSPGGTEVECMLKKVEDVERYLRKSNTFPEVLEACTMIRGAIAREMTTDVTDRNVDGETRVDPNAMEAPTKMLSAEDWGAYIGDEEENGIAAMLRMV